MKQRRPRPPHDFLHRAGWLALLMAGSVTGLMAEDLATLELHTVYRAARDPGPDEWFTRAEPPEPPSPDRSTVPQFRAVISRVWPPGLVPIYAVEWKNQTELRRRPRPGHENITEPLCFILPPAPEVAAAGLLTGRWECEASQPDGSRNFFAWELTLDGTNVAARFDQDTEYRFAYITGGSFNGHDVTLMVEYSSNRYELTGTLRENKLSGTWRHIGEADHGTWEATRDLTPPPRPPLEGMLPLYEWRRSTDGAVQYSILPQLPEPGWTRSAQPLGRVWPHP